MYKDKNNIDAKYLEIVSLSRFSFPIWTIYAKQYKWKGNSGDNTEVTISEKRYCKISIFLTGP